MKKEIKGFILGVICTLMFTSIATFASSQLKTIEVYENNVRIFANDNIVTAPNFTYNDTTYVPLRAVLELMDCSVFYDENTNSVSAYNDFVLNYSCNGTYFEDGEYIYDTITKRPNNNYDDYENYEIYIDHRVIEDNTGNIKSHYVVDSNNGIVLEWYWTDTSNYNSENTTTSSNMDLPLYLYSNDGKTYLGKLTLNEYDSDSIWNKYGTYGSEYSTNSIWNKYGTYGSKYSSYSAFNPYATTPPIIVSNSGKIIGYLSANKYLTDAYSVYDIYAFLSQYENQ